MTKVGIEETKEAITAISMVSEMLWERLKDGTNLEDLKFIMRTLADDDEFMSIVAEAWRGRDRIPAELKDVSPFEGLELGILLLRSVRRILT